MELECGLLRLVEVKIKPGQFKPVLVLARTFSEQGLEITGGPYGISLERGHLCGITQGPDRRVRSAEDRGQEFRGKVIVSRIDRKTHILGVVRNQKKRHSEKQSAGQKNPEKTYVQGNKFLSLRISIDASRGAIRTQGLRQMDRGDPVLLEWNAVRFLNEVLKKKLSPTSRVRQTLTI